MEDAQTNQAPPKYECLLKPEDLHTPIVLIKPNDFIQTAQIPSVGDKKLSQAKIEDAASLMSNIKYIAEAIKTNSNLSQLKQLDSYYIALINALENKKTYTEYAKTNNIKHTTAVFRTYQRSDRRHASSQIEHPASILKLLFASIAIINSTPAEISSPPTIDNDGFTITLTKKQSTKYYKQKKNYKKIIFFQKHAGVIITHLFAKALRAMDIEWRSNTQLDEKNEITNFFLEELTHGNAKKITEKYIQAQLDRKEHFENFRIPSYNTQTTLWSDGFWLLHHAKKSKLEKLEKLEKKPT